MDVDGGDGKYYSSDLLYVPDYSFDTTMESVFSNSYFRYGSNERTTSSSDLTVSVWDDFIDPLAFGALGSSSGDSFLDTYSDMVKEEILSQYPEYSGIIGTSEPLAVMNTSSDPFYRNMTDTYSSSVKEFVDGHSGETLYRLTFASGLSSSYVGLSGKATSYDGNWSDDDKVAMAKTDVILGFKFIDLTFKDEDNVLYTLPAASDSLDSAGDIHNSTTSSDDDGMPLWEIILIVVSVAVGMFLLGWIGKMYPMVKDLVGGMLKFGLFVVEVLLWVPYLVLVYPVRKLTARGAYVPVWPFGRRN